MTKVMFNFAVIYIVGFLFYNGYLRLGNPEEFMAWIIYWGIILVCGVGLLTGILGLILRGEKKSN
ncbi:hypothetical protein OCO53_25475 [Peribacillus frigoritolerans]|uniref:hypothetical protein n=1 Tax=Peribacillus frigoritolerans TaxID=450367 RepID=UPI0021D326FD|nr:hypothetical protein [Peribacillus frigoritolerans]MCU6603794.1 hypothetical protein [Peribacillus frigoritolerans]